MTVSETGEEHKKVIVRIVSSEDVRLAYTFATMVINFLEKNGLRILGALPAGPPRASDHDLIVERQGAGGKGSLHSPHELN